MKTNHLLLAAFLAFAAACSDADTGNGAVEPNNQIADAGARDASEPTGPVTYHEHVRPLVEENCVGCHDSGGIGPFELDNYEGLSTYASLALMSIEAGTMPPWSPDPDCRDIEDARLLSAEEIQLFRDWIEDGKLEGEAADYVAPDVEVVELGPPDIAAKPSAPFEPTVMGGDEYRCFLLDAQFEEDTFVTGIDVDPGNRGVVHHANMFLVNPTNAARVEALEAEDAQSGYRCFGDPGVATINLIGAWVPGVQPIQLPADTAVRIPAGSRIIMQTHFNTVYAEPEPVLSIFNLWTTDQVPSRVVRAMPFANLNFEVPAGEASSVHTEEFKNLSDKSWTVFGSAAHLHLLATKVKVEIVRADGGEECVLDIPKWDFDWQQAYFFEQDDWLEVHPGDKVRLTCEFDNSPENQPIIDGEQQAPQDLSWGGGTFDEMCLNFLVVAEEYDPSTVPMGELCEPFAMCRDECDDPYGVGCIFNCAAIELDCGECLLSGAQRCAQRYCPDELRASIPCLLNCAQGAQAGGDIDACLREKCPAERDDLEVCIRPRIEGGFCNADLDACNVEF